MVVIYSKVTESKLVMCDSDPRNARIWWKIIRFIRWILIMGEREQFLNQAQYYNANALSISFQNATNHVLMNNFYMSFSITSINSKNLIFNVFKNAKTKYLKENLMFTFQEEL